MRRRDIIKGAWLTLVGSGLLFAWQLAAYVTGNIPDHILPVVEVLSGTQEAVPIAYSWTIKLGVLSVAVFVFSLLIVILPRFLSPDRE